MSHSEIAGAQTIELTNCDKEPIHISGCIQPHGVLFALQEPELTVLHLSKNTFDFFGIHFQEFLGKNIDILLDSVQIKYIKEALL